MSGDPSRQAFYKQLYSAMDGPPADAKVLIQVWQDASGQWAAKSSDPKLDAKVAAFLAEITGE